MKRLVALALVLAVAATARASEESEALAARAQLALERGEQAEGMRLLDAAVAADPDDAGAHYQRGVALAKQKQFDAAGADFERALALRPNLDEAALELGIVRVEEGRPAEAERWLTQAAQRPALAGQAQFYLGIAHLRQERYEAARDAFDKARAADPSLEVMCRYYLGVVEYRMGNTEAARDHFLLVEELSPQTAVGRESTAFLELLRAGEGTATQLYGSVSLQYDTNVVLAPAQGLPAPAISDQADGRVTLNAGGYYEAWRSEKMRLSLGYDFYQNLQFELKDYNLMDNRPSAVLSVDLGPVQGGFVTQYDFYLLETDTFLQTVTAMPFLTVPEKDTGRTELYFRYQFRDYLQDEFDILDGNNYAGGARQVFALGMPGRELFAGFQVDSQLPTQPGGELYAYDAIQAEVGVVWPLPWTMTAQLGYRFRREAYDSATADFFEPPGEARLDRESRAGFALRKDINEIFAIVASWIGTWNDSNKDLFGYDRQIGSLGVEVRY